MKGHIKKRSENSYSVVVDVGRDPKTGKRKQKWYTVRGNKKTAEAFLAHLVDQLEQGTFIDAGKITVDQYLRRWLDEYARHNLKPRTLESYTTTIDKHVSPALGKVKLSKLQPTQIQRYYAEKMVGGRQDGKPGGLEAMSVLHHHQILHSALAAAVKWGLLSRNPADLVEPPKPQRRELRVMSPEEARRFLEVNKDHRLYALFLLAITTGMREAELVGLRWTDVDLVRGTIIVQQTIQRRRKEILIQGPKTETSRRLVTVTPDVAEVLGAHRRYQDQEVSFFGPAYDQHYLDLAFRTQYGTPIAGRNLVRTFKVLLRRAGLPEAIRFHDLRHTAASLGAAAGLEAKAVSERLGHSGIGITMDLYSHLFMGTKQVAAAKIGKVLFPGDGNTKDKDSNTEG